MTRNSRACVVRTFEWTLRGLVLSVILFSASLAAAQLTRGTITGTVTDQSGAAVPGTAVTITNVETGFTREAETGATGRYAAPNLPLGDYEVSVRLAGFQTSIRAGIELTVGRNAVVDHVLQVGEVTQAVTVTGEVAFVETTSATVSNLVDEQKVEDLPLNNRDLTQLTFLQPGVLKIPNSGEQSAFSGLGAKLTVAGARGTHNLYLLDGVSNGDLSNNAQSASGAYSGAETVKEFQIITNNYSAEYKSAAGAIISAVTKSGTNAFHGSLFEFLRNDNLDAAKWEDNAFGDEKPAFVRNQFGGSFGGPIVSDRTFFFTSYEGLRERLAKTDKFTMLSNNAHKGMLEIVDDNGEVTGFTEVDIDPAVVPYLVLFPLPGVGNVAGQIFDGGAQDIAGPSRTPTDQDYFLFKLDHNLSDNHQMSGTYNWEDTERLGPCGILCEVTSEAGRGTGITTTKHIVSFGLISVLSPSTLNEFHFGFGSTKPTENFRLSDKKFSDLVFSDNRDFVGEIAIRDGITSTGFSSDTSQYLVENLTFNEGLSFTRGNHSFRMGAEVRHSLFDQRSCSAGCSGEWRFDTLEDFFEAKPERFQLWIEDENGRGRGAVHEMIQWGFGSYFQDNWQVAPSFNLNLGVRWEFVTIPSNPEANTAALVNFNDTSTTIGPIMTNATKKSISPRIGFAWAPGDRKTSLRGGFGIFYIHPGLYQMRTGNQATPPFVQNTRLRARRGNIRDLDRDEDGNRPVIKLLFPNAFFAGQFSLPGINPRLNIRVPEYNAQNAYSYRWSMNLQREVADWVLSAGYTGSRALHLINQNRTNIFKWVIKDERDANSATVGVFPENPVPGQTYKYFPDEDDPDFIGENINTTFADFRLQNQNGNSYYHGMALGAQKRLSQGLQVQMAFNWSKAIDQGAGVSNNGDELGQGQRGLFGWDMEHKKGLSTQNIGKSFTSNFSYEFPRGDFGEIGNAILNGWQMNGIITLSDGSSIGVEDETDEQDDRFDDNESLRPDLVPGASNNPIEGTTAGCAGVAAGQKLGTPELYYDPCAFMPSLPGFFGNVARNTLTAPGIATFDWSVVKTFNISETSHIQFRAEFFNLLNRPNFRNPTVELFRNRSTRANPVYDPDVTGGDSHQITETRTSARQIQFGLRYVF